MTKLKTRNRKSIKLGNDKYKYKMRNEEGETINTGAEDYEPPTYETILSEGDFATQGGPTNNEEQVLGGEMASGFSRFTNLSQRDLGNMRRARQNTNRNFEGFGEIQNPDIYGEAFLTRRQQDTMNLSGERRRIRDYELRSGYIFNLIENNDIEAIQSLLQTDTFLNSNRNNIFTNGVDQNTFLTYAIRLGRLEIVKMMFASGFKLNDEFNPRDLVNGPDSNSNREMLRIIDIYSNNLLTPEQQFFEANSSRFSEGSQSVEELRQSAREQRILDNIISGVSNIAFGNSGSSSFQRGPNLTRRSGRNQREQRAIDEALPGNRERAMERERRRQERGNSLFAPGFDLLDGIVNLGDDIIAPFTPPVPAPAMEIYEELPPVVSGNMREQVRAFRDVVNSQMSDEDAALLLGFDNMTIDDNDDTIARGSHPTKQDIMEMKKDELKAICRRYGLKLSGNKKDLQNRILRYLESL